MKKRYLFLMTLLFPLAAMFSSGRVHAADPDKALYDAAISAITDGVYYITTEVDGVKFYLKQDGDFTDNQDDAYMYAVSQVDASGAADKLFNVAFLLDPGNGAHYSNSTLIDSKCNLHPNMSDGMPISGARVYRQDGSNNRNDWERQILYMNSEGKIAIRSCNTGFADSSWKDAGRAFWTYEVAPIEEGSDEVEPVYDDYGYIVPCYTYEPAFIWTFEKPAGRAQINMLLNAIYAEYELLNNDPDGDLSTPFGLGTDPGCYSDVESWQKFQELFGVLDELHEYFNDPENDEDYDPTAPDAFTEPDAKALHAQFDSLYRVILDSEVPYVPEEGYYRIVAHNRYRKAILGEDGKQLTDDEGNPAYEFLDKALGASYFDSHKKGDNFKAVYAALGREKANYIWKVTKSESGDSLLLQNAATGAYVCRSLTPGSDNRVFLTDDVSDAAYVQFDYAGPDYVEPNGVGDELDIFCIRLASQARPNHVKNEHGSYFHQNNHASVYNDEFGQSWGTESGKKYGEAEEDVSFWSRTWDFDYLGENPRTTDKWTSEWYLEPVSESELNQALAGYEAARDQDRLVVDNAALRAKVGEAITFAKDVQRVKMITSVSQLSSPNSDESEGKDLGVLIDGNIGNADQAGVFWHTSWHASNNDIKMRYTYDGVENEYHYLQISGMENMVGNCELYFCQRNGADYDHPSKIVLLGTDNLKNEDEDWDEVAILDIPNVGKGAENTIPFTVETPYPYIRLLVLEVKKADGSAMDHRTYWHASEIQFYTVEENPNSQFVLLGDLATNLESTYIANCETPDEQITQEIYQALLDAYMAFAAGLVDPAEIRNALAAYKNATRGVVQGVNPGYWEDTTIADQFNALYAEVDAYNKAGQYKTEEMHKYAAMLKAMQKSVMEKANGIKTDKWYRIMFPTEEMYDEFGFSKEGADATGHRKDDQGTMYGRFVAPGYVVTEEVAAPTDEDPDAVKNESHLEAFTTETMRDSRLFFMPDDVIEDKNVSLFRFVEKEAEEVDYVPMLLDAKENVALAFDLSTPLTRGEALIKDASQLSSNASDEAEGKDIGALIDNDKNTFWHSDWHKKVIAPPYLQVAFNEPVSGLIQVEITRRNNGFGHIVRMYVLGSNDGETWTNVGYLEAPYNGTPNSVVTCMPIDLGRANAYSYLRFINTCRALDGGGNSTEMDPFAEPQSVDEYDKTWTYFHAAEFQIYPVTPTYQMTPDVQTLLDAYTSINKVLIKDVTAENVASISEAYRTYRAGYNQAAGKDVLPYGKDKADPVYLIQNKANGLYVYVDGTGNQNNVYLTTSPITSSFKALGYYRSLLSAKNVKGENCNYLHGGESDGRLCTWTTTEPTTNSGLVICESDEEYLSPNEFTFYKDVRWGKIHNWCFGADVVNEPIEDSSNSEVHAYTALGRFANEDGDFLALKEVDLNFRAGQPTFVIFGDTTEYVVEEGEEPLMETLKFHIPAYPEFVAKGDTINGTIGIIATHKREAQQMYLSDSQNMFICPEDPSNTANLNAYNYGMVLDLGICPWFDTDENYDVAICLSGQANIADGIDAPAALEKISEPGNVYSMDGKLLRTGATLNSVKALGRGMYILNGVKVLVK
ncbi:MAG: discoidin domain-containing protein [Bacteroidaceae bacterium]|nr:discoidin domain-containing protein [Bacteroidaceae bacterium]